MKKIVLTFGLIAGVVMSSMMILAVTVIDTEHGTGSMVVGYTSMVLAFLMVYFGVRSYRDNVNGGVLSFGRGFRVGITIAAIGSVFYVATWEVVYRNFMPDFMEKYAASQIEAERKAGKSEAELAETQKTMAGYVESYKNPLYRAGLTFLEPLPVGLLMTLIAAGTLRRKSKSPA